MARMGTTPEGGLPRTLDKFVALHARRPGRWGFTAGEPVMVLPLSLRAALIKGNMHGLLHDALGQNRYHVSISGPEVRSVDLAAIPDVVVARRPVDQAAPVLSSTLAIF